MCVTHRGPNVKIGRGTGLMFSLVHMIRPATGPDNNLFRINRLKVLSLYNINNIIFVHGGVYNNILIILYIASTRATVTTTTFWHSGRGAHIYMIDGRRRVTRGGHACTYIIIIISYRQRDDDDDDSNNNNN